MALKHLKLSGFRNFSEKNLEFSPYFNIIYGPNGAGKTSILEAIFLLSTGRSFRTTNLQKLLNFDSDNFTVYAELLDKLSSKTILGHHKPKGQDKVVKLNGNKVSSIANIAEVFPTCCLELNNYRALQQPPVFRRKILDWGVFHVKHEFITVWKEYNHVLKQRNSLLRKAYLAQKDGRSINNLKKEIAGWDKLIASSSVVLVNLRQEWVSSLYNAFYKYINYIFKDSIGAKLDIKLKLKHGLLADNLQDILEEYKINTYNDIARGYTTIGPHRADLSFYTKSVQAKDILSRGQQKAVIIAYHLAQLECIKAITNKTCTILLDDLPSELDSRTQNLIYKLLYETGHQILISATDKNLLRDKSLELIPGEHINYIDLVNQQID